MNSDVKKRDIFISGDKSILYTFSLENHDLIGNIYVIKDLKNVGVSLTSMNCFYDQKDGKVIAIGATDGTVFLRKNENDIKEFHKLKKRIVDLIISNFGTFLLVACED